MIMNDQSTATATNANVTNAVSSPIASPQHGTAKASKSHLCAQQLNNSAALCIEIGHYRRAISSLQKALELNRNHRKEWKDRNEQVCKCYSCTLEGCIAYSENTASEAAVVDSIHSYVAVPNRNTKGTKINDVDANTMNNNNNKRRKVCTSPSVKIDSTFWKPPSPNKHQQQKPESFSNEHGDKNDGNKENASSQVPFDKSISNSSTTLPLEQRRNEIQQSCREEDDGDDDEDDDSISGGYIYRRPIRVSCEGHAMGSTLYLIITFNLALAHHLETINCYDGADAQSRSKLVNRTLVLYELTYKWHLKLLCPRRNSQAPAAFIVTASSSLSSSSTPSSTPPCTAVTSIRFNMIIRNNLSQIHRFVGNHAKHMKCLQHLLSTVMVVAEYKSRMPMNRVMSHRTKDPRCMELDGFLQNTTAIVLQRGHCANAA